MPKGAPNKRSTAEFKWHVVETMLRLPKTLAYILREWKKSQNELKGLLGNEYQAFNLVLALPNGRPCEDRIILKEFSEPREEAGLPRVVFHSLRHSSTTYKLKLNHGDLKATQGDTGHAEIDMITSIYAHILDEDLKVNTQKFETAFYANPDLRGVRSPEENEAAGTGDPGPGKPCGAASKVTGAGKRPGRPDRGAGSRKIGVGNQISKPLIFLSKSAKTVRVQLAHIHYAAHKNPPANRSHSPGEKDKINAAYPKKGRAAVFLAPPARLELTTFRLGAAKTEVLFSCFLPVIVDECRFF